LAEHLTNQGHAARLLGYCMEELLFQLQLALRHFRVQLVFADTDVTSPKNDHLSIVRPDLIRLSFTRYHIVMNQKRLQDKRY
jgi:hypothetical protein